MTHLAVCHYVVVVLLVLKLCMEPIRYAAYLLAGDKAGALVLPVGSFVTGTPEIVPVIESLLQAIPAATASMAAEYPPWRVKLRAGQTETTNEDDRYLRCPRKP